MKGLWIAFITVLSIFSSAYGGIFISLNSLAPKKEAVKKKKGRKKTREKQRQAKPLTPQKIKIEGIILGERKVVIIDGYPYTQGEVYKNCRIRAIYKRKVLFDCNGFKFFSEVGNENL